MGLGVSPTAATLPQSTVSSESQFPIQSALPRWSAASPGFSQSAPLAGSTSLPRVLSAHHLTDVFWLVDCFFNSSVVGVPCSLIFWHFGCSLILDWLLSSFCVCEEAKGFYLRLHIGPNSLFAFLKSFYSLLFFNLFFQPL